MTGTTPSIQAVFEDQVERTPDRVAVVFEDQSLTYQGLNARANQVANYLRQCGIGPEVLVGICVERSLKMIVGLMGILKAGGAYVPVDPRLPSKRAAFMLEDSSVSALLTQEYLLKILPSLKIPKICLDMDWGKIAQHSIENPLNLMIPESLAYAIYTSGSTGQPKSVGISHRALINFLMAFQSEIGFLGEDRLLAVTTISFDMAAAELWLPLISGAQICLAPKVTTNDGKMLAKLIDESNATVMQGTPATWQMLIEAGWKGTPLLKIFCGGDILSHLLANKLLARGSEVWNLYGPTEATVWSFASRILTENGSVTIGAPMANTEFFILDGCNSPVPMGTPGELYIGGTSLAHGYLNRPDLTAEKFLPNPWPSFPSACVYRTGDLVRSRDDSHLEFLGRLDHQVKVRGFRIELGEIETALCRHPAVQQAVVIAKTDQLDEKQLVAYLVFEYEKKTSHADIRESLKNHLPEYMIPGLFVPLDSFPLTPNGKVDRQSLPSPHSVPLLRTKPFVAPRTQIEKALERIWVETLGIHNLGVHENFFELGGNSLFATQIVSRVREKFNKELPVTQLFLTPTIDELAKHIMEPNTEDSPLSIPPITPVSRHKLLPLSYSQERVWFTEQLAEGCRAYQFQCAIRFKGKLNADVLQDCLNRIVQRHEIFRTTFSLSDGSPTQMIHLYHPFDLPVFTIEGSCHEEQEILTNKKIHEEFEKPFNLKQLPLIRWTLLKLGDLDHILIHVEHHMVHDGWSFHVFLRELFELYNALTQNKLASLPALPIQFVDFSCWQRKWVENGHLHSQMKYWKKQLSGCPSSLELPYDYPRPHGQSFKGAAPRVELAPSLSKALRLFSRQQKTTLFMSMVTAFVGLLYRYTGQHDLCVGTGIANRRLRECEDVIGMIVNNVVLRTRNIRGNQSAQELLEQLRVLVYEAYIHQDIPFDHIVRTVQPERHPSKNPLFQAMFSFHDTPLPNISLSSLNVSVLEVISNNTSKFDLNVIVIPWSNKEYASIPNTGDEGITLIWEYNTDLFSSQTINQMIESYQTFLHGMVANPHQPLSTLPLLTDSHVRQQIVEWNDTRRNYARNASISELFEEEVQRSADTIAIVFGDNQLTYQGLNAKANQLAHFLRRQGVGPEVCVGVCLERGVNLLVSLLAILKAGGAYVPLDPVYPKKRLAYMLANAQAPVLLTQASIRSRLPAYTGQVITLEGESFQHESSENLLCSTVPKNLSYVLYTSGSTGRPKGVLISHAGLMNYLTWCIEAYEVEKTTEAIVHSSIGFDLTITSLFAPLLVGRKVRLLDEAVSLEEIGAALRIHGEFSLLKMTPSHLEGLNQLLTPEEVSGRIRILILGGEALSEKTLAGWKRHAPRPKIINEYGPTETVVGCCVYEVLSESSLKGLVPIGRPISNMQMYLLDRNMQLLPIGIPGEMYIGGVGLARGYQGRPDLTAERFIPHPHNKDSGTRLYKSGDLGRYLPDGTIEFLGRMDSQVKIRGYRIEPEEIRTILDQHPGVQASVVVCQEDITDGKNLVAYFVPSPEAPIEPAILSKYLRTHFPDYMVPVAFVPLDIIPTTPNGKINRHALSSLNQTPRLQATAYLAPQTPLEEILVEIWGVVLKVENISVHDNFFALGGHSLLATRVIARLRQMLEISVPLRTIFDHPTIAQLAQAIDTQLADTFQAGPTHDRPAHS